MTYNLLKVSIDIKNATNAPTKVCVFAIHLPQRSLFENLDLAYLGSNWHQVLSPKHSALSHGEAKLWREEIGLRAKSLELRAKSLELRAWGLEIGA